MTVINLYLEVDNKTQCYVYYISIWREKELYFVSFLSFVVKTG